MNLANTSAVLQPVAVLREAGRIPNRIVGRKAHEPAVQQIVVQLLHQLAFRPDAVEHLQQQSAQQLLRRNRRAAFARIELGPRLRFSSPSTSRTSSRILPQRMVRRHPCLRRDVRKQPALIHKFASHASLRQFVIEN